MESNQESINPPSPPHNRITGPFLLNKLISFLASDAPVYRGFEYLVLLFFSGTNMLCIIYKVVWMCLQATKPSQPDKPPHTKPTNTAVASSICLHSYFHRCFRTGMRLKSAVIGRVIIYVSIFDR